MDSSETNKAKKLENDPEYEEIQFNSREQQLEIFKKDAKEATIRKIQDVINSNFTEEIQRKENELETIQKNLIEAKCMMDHLRACIITKYFARDILKENKDFESPDWVHPNAKLYTGKAPCWADIKADHDYPILTPEPLEKETSTLSQMKILEKDVGFASNPVSKANSALTVRTGVKIIVGNISKYILSEERNSSTDQATHKWMVYVRPQDPKIEASNLISRILVFLHPSYKPNDLVEISKPPFCLCRRGWGEFPIRVQIHFHDPRNKPVDIIHLLKLDKTFTGLQTLGGESVIEVSLYTSKEQSPVKTNKSTISASLQSVNNFSTNTSKSENFVKQTKQPSEKDVIPMEIDLENVPDIKNSLSLSVSDNINNDEHYNNMSTENNSQEVINRSFTVNNVVNQETFCENLHAKGLEALKTQNLLTTDKILTMEASKESPPCNRSSNHIQETCPSIPVLNGIKLLPSTVSRVSTHSVIVPKQMSLLRNDSKPEPVLLIHSETPIKITVKSNSRDTNSDSSQTVHYFKPNANGECLVPISLLKMKTNPEPPSPSSELSWSQRARICEQELEKFVSRLRKNEYQTLEELMIRLIKLYPLITSDPHFPFCALSEAEFKSWNIGRQRASEWSRARHVHNSLKKIQCNKKLEFLSFKRLWSVKEILKWTRKHGYASQIDTYLESRVPIPEFSLTCTKKLLNRLENTQSELENVQKFCERENEPSDEYLDVETVSRNEEPTHRKRITSSRLAPDSTEEPVESNLSEIALMQACKEFLSDVLHEAIGQSGCHKDDEGFTTIRCSDVYSAILNLPFCDFLTNRNLGIEQL